MKQLRDALAKALPQQPILNVVDSSADENAMLIFAGSDSDPGVYYLFDRKARQLDTFLVARNELEGVKLASVKSITYPSSDGVQVPAYLTLPAGTTSPKGLPAIVLPHGGPSARDYWGFDWLSQFYASRGFVVLQPEFRGSSVTATPGSSRTASSHGRSRSATWPPPATGSSTRGWIRRSSASSDGPMGATRHCSRR